MVARVKLKTTFSENWIKALPAAPAGTRQDWADSEVDRFFLRVTDKGAKSFILYTRFPGASAPSRRALGEWPKLSLHDARTKAKEWLALIGQGIDPKTLEQASKTEQQEQQRNTFQAVCEEWLKRDQADKRSKPQTEYRMKKYVYPDWSKKPIGTITKRDYLALLEGIADRGAATTALRIQKHLNRLFKWAAQRDIVTTNPTRDVPLVAKENTRDRVLSDEELRLVWLAAGKVDATFGRIVRLLILTGARKMEIAGLRWSELDADRTTITLEGERTKNGAPHIIPLTDPAREVLRRCLRLKDQAGRPVPHIFTTAAGKPLSNFDRSLKILKAKADAIREEEAEGAKLEPADHWTIHDLRRTVATGLQRLGTRLEVTEAVLGHVSGSRGGIVGVYQRHTYAEEKRAALEAWSEHVERLSEKKSGGI